MFGEEAVDGMKIGVALIFLSISLVIGLPSILMGKGAIEDYFATLDNRNDASAVEDFKDFTGEGRVVPVAAAYAIINYNADSVSTIDCRLENPSRGNIFEDVESSCLKNHVRGECKLRAAYNADTNTYDITLYPVN